MTPTLMQDWHQRFFSDTRSRIIQILRRTEASAGDLAEELQVTPTAIRSHLAKLERDELIQKTGKRPGVRKPETLFTLTPEAESLFPKAYELLLDHVLAGLKRRLNDDEMEDFIDEMGREIGTPTHTTVATSDLRDDLNRAMSVLNEMGGLAEIEERDSAFVIRGHSCPVSALTPHHPEVCDIVRVILQKITGASVEEICERPDTPRCVFRISRNTSPHETSEGT